MSMNNSDNDNSTRSTTMVASKERLSSDGVPYIDIMPMPFVGTRDLINKHGGVGDLPVIEQRRGVFVSAWALHNKHLQRFMKKHPRFALTVIINANVVPGTHPEITMRLQAIDIVPDDVEGTA